MKVEIVPARMEHLIHVVENLREEDARIGAVVAEPLEKIMAQEYAKSILTYTGMLDDEPIVIWGVRTVGVLSDEAYLWLAGTEKIKQHPITFLRHSRSAVEELRRIYRQMYGIVWADFDFSIKWLNWLGFQVNAPEGNMRLFQWP